MDNAAWDRRAIFQRTSPESEALAARGIGDFGSMSSGSTSRVNAAPPPVVTEEPGLAKQERESQMMAALVQR